MSAAHIETVSIQSIRETPENWTIYNRPGNEPEFLALVESIKEHGIQTPLHVSTDDFIVSGHRRHAAGISAGARTAPIIRLDVEVGPMEPAERVSLLTEHNKGSRQKTQQEIIREAMVNIDPEAAIAEAENRRSKHLTTIDCLFTPIEARGKINRSKAGGAREVFQNEILEILSEMHREGNLPTSGRGIHYCLLHRKVRTSTYANGHIYGEHWVLNKDKGEMELKDSSPALYKILSDMRAEGVIDDSWIADETRPVWIPMLYSDPSEYMKEVIGGFMEDYFIDPHRDQDSHIEIMVEKNTVYPLIQRRVADPLRLPINSCRGYSSGSQRARVVERFRASGKRHLTIIYAGDHDPDGIEMPKALVKYMLHDLGVKPRIIRAAVNTDQIEKYNLIPDMEAKKTSTRFKTYFKETGMTDAWEIDSMPAEVRIDEITKACKSVIDIDLFNKAMEQEKQDDIRLAGLRAKAIRFFRENSSMLNR